MITWDPPRRLVLAWHLNAEWQYDPEFLTEVAVTFVEEDPGSTRLDVEHRNIDRFGDAAEPVRTALNGDGGWSQILGAYAKAF